MSFKNDWDSVPSRYCVLPWNRSTSPAAFIFGLSSASSEIIINIKILLAAGLSHYTKN